MVKKWLLIFTIIIIPVFTGCDVLMQLASDMSTQEEGLTTTEVSKGLKEALRIGAETAVETLHEKDGYFLDPLVFIDLPPEAEQLIEYASKVPGLNKFIDDIKLQINRSAEDAAMRAKPILVDAITGMSISDAWGILNGADSAATVYLKSQTRNKLVQLYQPEINQSLSKPLVAGISANQTWNEMTGLWNKFSGTIAGKLLSAEQINFTLGEYVTGKALDGLFIKVKDQEKKIRTDISARTSDLLRKVFGR